MSSFRMRVTGVLLGLALALAAVVPAVGAGAVADVAPLAATSGVELPDLSKYCGGENSWGGQSDGPRGPIIPCGRTWDLGPVRDVTNRTVVCRGKAGNTIVIRTDPVIKGSPRYC